MSNAGMLPTCGGRAKPKAKTTDWGPAIIVGAAGIVVLIVHVWRQKRSRAPVGEAQDADAPRFYRPNPGRDTTGVISRFPVETDAHGTNLPLLLAAFDRPYLRWRSCLGPLMASRPSST